MLWEEKRHFFTTVFCFAVLWFPSFGGLTVILFLAQISWKLWNHLAVSLSDRCCWSFLLTSYTSVVPLVQQQSVMVKFITYCKSCGIHSVRTNTVVLGSLRCLASYVQQALLLSCLLGFKFWKPANDLLCSTSKMQSTVMFAFA